MYGGDSWVNWYAVEFSPLIIISIAATTSPLHLFKMPSISTRLRLGNTFIRTSTGDFWNGEGSSVAVSTVSFLSRLNILYLNSEFSQDFSSSSFLIGNSSLCSFMERFSGVSEDSVSSNSSSTLSSWSDGEREGGVVSGGVGTGVLDSDCCSVGGEGLEHTSVIRARF